MSIIETRESLLCRELSRELMRSEEGSRIPTTTEIASRYQVGLGSVEKALSTLKDSGAVVLKARGKNGTFLVSKDQHKLFEFTGIDYFVGQLPLPNSIEYEGLATAFTKVFSESDVPCNLSFKNGSYARLENLLKRRADFIVVSEVCAQAFCSKSDVVVVADLSAHSFYSNMFVLSRSDQKERRNWKIGVDATSHDNQYLSNMLFPDNPKVNLSYYNFQHAIAHGEIDAAIVHSRSFSSSISLTDEFDIQTLGDDLLGKMTGASVLARKDDRLFIELFEKTIDLARLSDVVEKVVNREMVPTF